MKRRRGPWVAGVAAALAVAIAAALAWSLRPGEAGEAAAIEELPVTPALVERGAYLALAGNCAGCHTEPGGAPFAGGSGIVTPYGTVYAGNLTPDTTTGIGRWTAADFRRALHEGRSKDGRLLYPAFPYPDYTQVTAADADALWAYLRTQPAVRQANRPHALRFPYDRQAALAVWRALYFRPQTFEPRADKGAVWNRGAYLVRGLGHCGSCHAPRNALGAREGDRDTFGGSPMPSGHWHATSLAGTGTRHRSAAELVDLLKTGSSARGSVLGPMAEVVFRSTQYLDSTDLQAIAAFLSDLPPSAPAPVAGDAPASDVMRRGAALYEKHCADCHGDQGQGATGAYPALAGSHTVTMAPPTNLVRVILDGGFPPTTQGRPRPYGMPPFGQTLSRAEVADLATYLRNAWGNQAPPVTELDASRAP